MNKKYRKKPVTIEAIQWLGTNLSEIDDFVGGSIANKGTTLVIHTLEGDMEASIGDYIIKGVKGEFYPCKPDIFAKTYEEIEQLSCKEVIWVNKESNHLVLILKTLDVNIQYQDKSVKQMGVMTQQKLIENNYDSRRIRKSYLY